MTIHKQKSNTVPTNKEDKKEHKEWKKRKNEETERIWQEIEKDEYEELSSDRRRNNNL